MSHTSEYLANSLYFNVFSIIDVRTKVLDGFFFYTFFFIFFFIAVAMRFRGTIVSSSLFIYCGLNTNCVAGE